MSRTEARVSAASRKLAKALVAIRADDAELADHLSEVLAREMQRWRESKRTPAGGLVVVEINIPERNRQ